MAPTSRALFWPEAVRRQYWSAASDPAPVAARRIAVGTHRGDDASADADLVAATLSGDRAAFGHLVTRYQKRAFALAYRYLAHADDAADLTQQAFLKTFENLDRLERRSSFSAWLFKTVANLCKNEIRFRSTKSFRDLDETPLAAPSRAEAHVHDRQRSAALRAALAELPDKQRRCVLLRIDGDLSFREVGQAVGCSTVSARVNFHHALRALKRRLRREERGGSTPPLDKES